MFKCVECGTKFEMKPDFCDCGNDIFEIIDEEPIIKQGSQKDSFSEDYSAMDNINSIPKIQKQSLKVEPVKTFEQQYPELAKFKSSLDPISVLVFLMCVILSFCIVFFVGNPKETTQEHKTQAQKEESVVQNIPSVESYWDNSTEGVIPDNIAEIEVNNEQIVLETPVQTEVQPQEQAQQAPQDAFSIKFEQWLNKPKREDTYSTQHVASVSQPVQKTTSKVQTEKQKTVQPKTQIPSTTVKTVSQTPTKTTTQTSSSKSNTQTDLLSRIQNSIQFSNNTQTQTKPATQTQSSKTISQTASVTVPAVPRTIYVNTTTPSTTTQTQTKPVLRNAEHQQVKTQAELRQELNTYKSGLRNTLGKKINFANVVGDGNCAITFKVDSNGKLVSRNFAQQSSNITLNDAVYKAMMSTPSYNPPPEGYKSETMTLGVKIYDGNYEITLN